MKLDMTENYNRELTPEMRAKLARIKHVALDMDGTIYLGKNIFPYTIGFLDDLKKAGIGYSFLTNNPTSSVADYLKKLEGMGIHADEGNMYTTSLAAIDYIREKWPDARRLYMLGTPSMVSQFEKAGFETEDIVFKDITIQKPSVTLPLALCRGVTLANIACVQD